MLRAMRPKEPLYRKVNTRARGVHHHFGGDYRHQRNTADEDDPTRTRGSMHGSKRRGLDYTPLFRFLLSKVGEDWDAVYGEADARLDRPDPIFWLVARTEADERDYVCLGESSYYSGLTIDAEVGLAIAGVAALTAQTMFVAGLLVDR